MIDVRWTDINIENNLNVDRQSSIVDHQSPALESIDSNSIWLKDELTKNIKGCEYISNCIWIWLNTVHQTQTPWTAHALVITNNCYIPKQSMFGISIRFDLEGEKSWKTHNSNNKIVLIWMNASWTTPVAIICSYYTPQVQNFIIIEYAVKSICLRFLMKTFLLKMINDQRFNYIQFSAQTAKCLSFIGYWKKLWNYLNLFKWSLITFELIDNRFSHFRSVYWKIIFEYYYFFFLFSRCNCQLFVNRKLASDS